MMCAHFWVNLICIEGGVPTEDCQRLKDTLDMSVAGTDKPVPIFEIAPRNPIKKPKEPPTYIPVNSFLSPYQSIVDTYGSVT